MLSDRVSDGNPAVTTWLALRARWPSRPARDRRRDALRAGRQARGLWKRGVDLLRTPLDILPLGSSPDEAGTAIAAPAVPQGRDAVLDALAAWHSVSRDEVGTIEALLFLRGFMDGESMDRAAFRFAAADVERRALRLAARRARAVYRLESRLAGGRGRGEGVTGAWSPDPSLPADFLARAVEEAEAAPGALTLKQTPRIRVTRAELFGQDAVIKRYAAPTGLLRLKNRFRASRARRAWAAARTLQRAGLPTPRPLGVLEWRHGAARGAGCYVAEYVADAVTLREAAERHYAGWPPAERDRLRAAVAHLLLRLCGHGILHRDMKASNLLWTPAAATGEDGPSLWLTDLECVRAGRVATRHDWIRGLVQLNGSLLHVVGKAERRRFLEEIGRLQPWVLRPRVARRIEAWTRRRLEREAHRACGF